MIGGHAFAGPRAVSKILGTVTAFSHDGNGSIRAPYRNTDVGYQVRLPHGTWVYCKTSCSETLRVNTVDVWANVDNANPIGVGTLQAGMRHRRLPALGVGLLSSRTRMARTCHPGLAGIWLR